MATTARIPVELYLTGEYEPDVDYVDGCIEDRNLGEDNHSKWQLALQLWFASHAEEWNIFVRPELRVHVSPTRYRVADVTLLDPNQPRERIPTRAPLAVFEVLSPEDRLSRVKVRLADFAAMGVEEVWLIDPENNSFERFENGQLVRREQFTLPQRNVSFAVTEITRLVR